MHTYMHILSYFSFYNIFEHSRSYLCDNLIKKEYKKKKYL